jgi:ferredoxin
MSDVAKIRVIADREACVSAGQCTRVAPEVFDQDETDGLVVVRQEHPARELESRVEEAVRLCPSRAITLERRGG